MTPPKKPADKKSGGGLSDRAANIITGVVTTVWVVSFLAGLFQFHGYQPDAGVNTIFTVIVGGSFVLRNKNKSGD